MNLYDKLIEYSNQGYYPMHMPGHKRNTEMLSMTNPYSIDITEIEGFDNLHHADGILHDGMNRAAALYGSEHTDYLIGSSTAGLLAGIVGCTKKGDKVLVARNCHKAVYHAIYLNELYPIYILPEHVENFGIHGGLIPENIEEMLIKHQDIKLIIITSPTYEGIVTDVKAIADIAHNFGIPLLVDEAHGSHLGFHSYFPVDSVKLGADIVIHSLHKTLPSFTQTGLIHVNGNLAPYDRIKRYLSIFQSSSPSYLLMSSIEQCVTMLNTKKDELFAKYVRRLDNFYNSMDQLKHLKVLTKGAIKGSAVFGLDSSKITICVKNTNITGNQLYHDLLYKYKIQMEMVSMDYVLGMTSICDTDEGFHRLSKALLTIDAELDHQKKNIDYEKSNISSDKHDFNNEKDVTLAIYKKKESMLDNSHNCILNALPEVAIAPFKALECPYERTQLTKSEGRIAADYINLYPPGIPILVPGERINLELINQVIKCLENGLTVQGIIEDKVPYINVIGSNCN